MILYYSWRYDVLVVIGVEAAIFASRKERKVLGRTISTSRLISRFSDKRLDLQPQTGRTMVQGQKPISPYALSSAEAPADRAG
jgi:hypothetical protein